MKISQRFHLGIYAIVMNNDSILLIKKSRGPYKGKLDLPGGKPEYGETPNETVIREVAEETGVKVHFSKLFDNYSTIGTEIISENAQEKTHHLGMIYIVISYDDSLLTNTMNDEDSLGAQWYSLSTLTQDILSPFAFRAINDIQALYNNAAFITY